MENLIFNRNKLLNTRNFVRVGDLSYFEGPLLSLFEELNSGHLYLFDWVDRDQKTNRWLIYRVSPKSVLQFLTCKISHLELFQKRPYNTVFFADIDAKNKLFSNYNSFELDHLVPNYYPNSDNFFDISDYNSIEKIKSVILNSLSRQKTENEYSVVYKINILKRSETQSAYFNRVPIVKKSVSFPSRRSNIANFEKPNNLAWNDIQDCVFKSNSIFKKQNTLNKKEYANQYY